MKIWIYLSSISHKTLTLLTFMFWKSCPTNITMELSCSRYWAEFSLPREEETWGHHKLCHTCLEGECELFKKKRRALLKSLTLTCFCGWLPVIHIDDGQADLTFFIHVGMVDFRLEGDLGWLKRVLNRVNDFNFKCSFVIWRGILGWKKNKQNKTLVTCCSSPSNFHCLLSKWTSQFYSFIDHSLTDQS